MQVGGEKYAAAKAAQQREVERHMHWRATFFAPMPAPQPMAPAKRQRESSRVVGADSGTLMAALRAHVAAAGPAGPLSMCVPSDAARAEAHPPADLAAAEAPVLSSSAAAVAAEHPLRAQLREELRLRNPRTDPQVAGRPDCTMIVARLSATTDNLALRAFGERFGRVVRARVVRRRCDAGQGSVDGGVLTFGALGASRRYGFVEFATPAELRKALRETGAAGGPPQPQSRRNTLLDGAHVRCDAERGRLDPRFVPRRLRKVAAAERALGVAANGVAAATKGGGSDIDALLDDVEALLAA